LFQAAACSLAATIKAFSADYVVRLHKEEEHRHRVQERAQVFKRLDMANAFDYDRTTWIPVGPGQRPAAERIPPRRDERLAYGLEHFP
jgi:hypothetical protein